VGMTFVDIGWSNTPDGPVQTIRLLVDTGAFYSMVPREVLGSAGIRPAWRQRFRLANRQPLERDVGFAFAHYPGRLPPAATHVIFGEPGDAAILGAFTIGGLEMEVDPRSGELRPLTSLPLIALVPA